MCIVQNGFFLVYLGLFEYFCTIQNILMHFSLNEDMFVCFFFLTGRSRLDYTMTNQETVTTKPWTPSSEASSHVEIQCVSSTKRLEPVCAVSNEDPKSNHDIIFDLSSGSGRCNTSASYTHLTSLVSGVISGCKISFSTPERKQLDMNTKRQASERLHTYLRWEWPRWCALTLVWTQRALDMRLVSESLWAVRRSFTFN